MNYVDLIILLALVEYIFLIMLVGYSRSKFGVNAPAVAGNSEWERLHRIQVNTTEQLVLFLPAIYAFAHYISAVLAAGLGVFFLVGRVVYYLGYKSAGDKRLPGAIMSAFTSYIMVIGAIAGLVVQMVSS